MKNKKTEIDQSVNNKKTEIDQKIINIKTKKPISLIGCAYVKFNSCEIKVLKKVVCIKLSIWHRSVIKNKVECTP